MNYIRSEILRLFPELRSRVCEGDEELPHVMMGHAGDWVKETYSEKNEGSIEFRGILSRIRTLRDWCLEQDDDKEAYTVYIVSFYEPLCEFHRTHSLVPLITTKQEFMDSEDYLTSWIGVENYKEILRNWDRKGLTSRWR